MSPEQLPQFQFDEKEHTIRVSRPGTPIHWGVVLNFILAVLGSIVAYAVLTGIFQQTVNVYTVALAIFFGFMLVYTVMSFIALVIASRFGYRGDWTLTAIIIYLIATAAILISMWILIIPA